MRVGMLLSPQTVYQFGAVWGSMPQAHANRKRLVELKRLHQQEMTSDVAKLLSLATSLQQEAMSGSANSLNSEDKAKQIEKLAKQVRSLMEEPLPNP